MDFRQYDNAIGRFNSIDALTEAMYSINPYHFSHNNPTFFSDPTGLASNLLLYDFEGNLHVVTPDQYVSVGFSNDSEETSAGAALEYLSNSFGGSGGNVSVVRPTAPTGLLPSGTIIFKNLTDAQLKDFAVITEDVSAESPVFIPQKNGTYAGDGVFIRNFTSEKYWYKVSGGSTVTITYSEGSYFYSKDISSFWKNVASLSGKEYYVGFKSINNAHWAENPFNKNK